MPNFKGFSTIDKDKKFSLTDRELIRRDLLNAFNIRAGSMPGRPEVGTKLWDYIFDPNDDLTASRVEGEVRRIIELDIRVALNEIEVTTALNTVRAHISVSFLPDQSVEEFFIVFEQDTQTATIA